MTVIAALDLAADDEALVWPQKPDVVNARYVRYRVFEQVEVVIAMLDRLVHGKLQTQKVDGVDGICSIVSFAQPSFEMCIVI